MSSDFSTLSLLRPTPYALSRRFPRTASPAEPSFGNETAICYTNLSRELRTCNSDVTIQDTTTLHLEGHRARICYNDTRIFSLSNLESNCSYDQENDNPSETDEISLPHFAPRQTPTFIYKTSIHLTSQIISIENDLAPLWIASPQRLGLWAKYC